MPGTGYTRATLRARWLTMLQDPTGRHFTSSLFESLLNDAMGDWCELTKSRIESTTIDIVANQAVYNLTSVAPRVIEIKRASCPTSAGATDDKRLELKTVEEMDDPDTGCTNWRSDASSWPYILIRNYDGPQKLRLYPTPASSQEAQVRAGTWFASQATGAMMSLEGLTVSEATAITGGLMSVEWLVGTLVLNYVAHSTDITSDATTVESACGISPDRQDALLWYTLARACEYAVPISIREKAATYWEKWQSEVANATQLQQSGFQPRVPRTIPGSNF